jgi:hypothetical protein
MAWDFCAAPDFQPTLVHKVTIAKSELARYQAVEGWPSEHVPTRLAIAKERFAHLLEAGA